MGTRSRRRGRPRWVIPVIAIGIVLNLGLTGAGVVAVSGLGSQGALGSAASTSDAPVFGGESEGDTPDTFETGLDTSATFETANAPVWSFPSLEGYDFEVIDEQGINRQVDPSTGCTATTSQTMQEPLDPDATSDRDDSEASMAVVVQTLSEGLVDVSPPSDLTTEKIAVGTMGAQDTLEFLSTSFTFSGEDGSYTYRIVLRALPRPHSLMWLSVVCPTSVFDESPRTFDRILNRSAVAPV